MTRPKPKRPAPDTPRYRAESDPHLSRAINRFQRAVEAEAFSGSMHPDDSIDILDELDAAKASLLRVVNRRVNK